MEKYMLIGDYLRHWSQIKGDTEALVWNSVRLTYRDYHDQVSLCTKALLQLGVKKGDRVAVLSFPRPEVMILYVAISEIGAIFVGMNDKGKLGEFKYVMEDGQPVAFFSILSHTDRDYQEDIREISRTFNFIKKVITFDGSIPDTSCSYQQFLEQGNALTEDHLSNARSLVSPEDPAIIVYTSGTTGKPKGALITHRSVLAGMGAQADRFRKVDPFRTIFCVPIHHLGSIGNVGTATLILGGTIVFMDRFSPKNSLELIEREKITLWGQVPTMFLMQLAVPEFKQFDLSNVQAIFFAGSAISREAVIQLAKTGIPDLVTGYGLTETCGPVTLSEPGASIEELSDTIGKPVPGVDLKIADDAGNIAPVGQAGEIWVRGDCIFKGYFNRAEATREAIDSDGWFKSGDLAIADERRNIRIIGRKQEVFKSGGSNVYPQEIEEVILSHPEIAIACVVSVQDPIYQEVGYAFVVPRSDTHLEEESLKIFCSEKLAKYKVPRRFDIRQSLPTIGIGKVDRAWLKKEALSILKGSRGDRPTSSTTASSMRLGILPGSCLIFDKHNAPHLLGGRCSACGEISFPKAAGCQSCLSEDISPIALSLQGRLYSYTVLHVGKPGEITPYAIGYVDLPEGVRIFSYLTTIRDLRPDLPVKLYVAATGDEKSDEPLFAFGFSPAKEDVNHA